MVALHLEKRSDRFCLNSHQNHSVQGRLAHWNRLRKSNAVLLRNTFPPPPSQADNLFAPAEFLMVEVTTQAQCRGALWYGNEAGFGITCSVQFSSVTQSFPTLCNPMNRSMPGLPVHHQLPEFTQTHVHQVGDAIQPSHPLSSPSPPAPNASQHQSLFQWVNSSHEVAKVLEFQL